MTREVTIPFAGFYESMWSQMLDHALERTAEYEHEKQSSEHHFDERLHLDVSEYHDAIFMATDYSAAYDEIAKDYAKAFNEALAEHIGFDVGLTFATMTSPRFYNFETDRIFCNITDDAARQLFAFSAADDHATFKAMIEERHTSRSGFHSFYSTEDDSWFTADAPDGYDHNETATLLLACMKLAGMKQREWEWDVYEALSEHDYEYENIALDYAKFSAGIEARREELRTELRAIDPEFEPLPERCPLTPDMFEPRA